MILSVMSMKQIADWALNTATQRGGQYADVRIVDDRQRNLATKNARIGHAGSSESLGIGVRVVVNHIGLNKEIPGNLGRTRNKI